MRTFKNLTFRMYEFRLVTEICLGAECQTNTFFTFYYLIRKWFTSSNELEQLEQGIETIKEKMKYRLLVDNKRFPDKQAFEH